MSTPQEWYFSIPPVTRAWLTAAVLSSFGFRFGLVNPNNLAFLIDSVINKFQIWRIFLNFVFFGKLSFSWVIQMVMLTRYGSALEDNPYPSGGGTRRGNIADFVVMLAFGGSLLLGASAYLMVPYMATSLAFMVIYVWSKRNPGTEVTFYFFTMPGVYLPWALILWSLAIGDDPTMDLLGLAAGHLYYFLVDALPNSPGTGLAGKKLLWTPDFVYRIFGVQATHAPSAVMNMREGQAAAGGGGRHDWGQGQALGR